MPQLPKFKNPKLNVEYDVGTYAKGVVFSGTVDGKPVKEYIQFKEIRQIIHHPGTGVEIVYFGGQRKVLFNDTTGESQTLYDGIIFAMDTWMDL